MKLACFVETCAPPTVKPLSPHDSISRAAWSPGGLRKTLPALGRLSGCVATRRSSSAFMRAIAVAPSPGANAKVPRDEPLLARRALHDVPVADLVVRRGAHAQQSRRDRPSSRRPRCPTSRRRSSRRSWRAPRRPCPGCRPATRRPRSRGARRSGRDAGRERRRPRRTAWREPSTPAARIPPSAWCVKTTVPSKPPSRTRRLLPSPTKRIGSSAGRVARKRLQVRDVRGLVERPCARPPARQLTCRSIGSSHAQHAAERRRRSPREHRCPRRLADRVHVAPPAARASSRREARDRAGAHGDHDVAVAHRGEHRVRHLRHLLDEYRLHLACDAHGAHERASVGRHDREPRPRGTRRRAPAHPRSRARARNPRRGRACACSGAAGTRAGADGPGKAPRAAARVAAISAGWWP